MFKRNDRVKMSARFIQSNQGLGWGGRTGRVASVGRSILVVFDSGSGEFRPDELELLEEPDPRPEADGALDFDLPLMSGRVR